MAVQQTFERKSIYKDFDLSFSRHPLTDDIGVKSDANAINQSLLSLVATNFYERPFQPQIGCNIRSLLFQPADPITVNDLRQAISETIGNYEPRVSLIDIFIEDRPDLNAYNLRITYRINNRNEASTLEVVLKRLR